MQAPTQGNKISNSIKIEKNNKFYDLQLSCDDKNIIIKLTINEPLKIFEKKYDKKELENICKIFKAYDNISEAYTCILNSIENKNYTFNINDSLIKIKLNDISTFQFKEFIIPEKEIELSEKIHNLYFMNENLSKKNENLLKEVNSLKLQIEELKKETNLLKENQIEELKINLIQGSNYGGDHPQFKVYRIKNINLIKFSGLINCEYHYDKPIFVLPEDCRPKGRLVFTTLKNGGLGRVDVYSNGKVSVCDSSNQKGWLSLDGISFFAGL
jgi:hypothetical protein